MQSRTCILSAITLTLAMSLGAAAMAADMPKEGTFNGSWYGSGAGKATALGKEVLLSAFEQNALTLGNGLIDHLTWHCSGLYEMTKGMAEHHGYCVATDPAGDQFAGNFASDGKYPADAKSYSGAVTFIGGAGKYAGIIGGFKYVGHAPEFRAAAGDAFFEYITLQGSYKLP